MHDHCNIDAEGVSVLLACMHACMIPGYQLHAVYVRRSTYTMNHRSGFGVAH